MDGVNSCSRRGWSYGPNNQLDRKPALGFFAWQHANRYYNQILICKSEYTCNAKHLSGNMLDNPTKNKLNEDKYI